MTKRAAIFFLLLFSLPCPTHPITWKKTVVPGITYSHIKDDSTRNFLHIHILKIDLNNKKIKVRPELARGIIGGIDTTSSIAINSSSIAAVNGSFFEAKKKLHLPVGLLIIDGEVLSRGPFKRAAFGITSSREVVFGTPETNGFIRNTTNRVSVKIWGVNRPRKKDEVIVYTDEWGAVTRSNWFGREIVVGSDGIVKDITHGNSFIPADGYVISLHGWTKDFADKTKVGDKLELVYNLTGKWCNVKHAVMGGPFLVRDGKIVEEESVKEENFKSDMLRPSSRTAIGITANNELILAVVDKRSRMSRGATYAELAKIMLDAGAVDAIGLDGGHASTMYVDGRVMNMPLTGYEGRVSNAITIKYEGWHLASLPKARYTYIYVYNPPSQKLIEALIEGADLKPSFYVPRPEDMGMWGLFDIYERVIKPVIPVFTMPQEADTLEAEK